jgi:hypothetical protein
MDPRQIDPEDQQAVFTIAGAIALLAFGLWALDRTGIKFAVGVTG